MGNRQSLVGTSPDGQHKQKNVKGWTPCYLPGNSVSLSQITRLRTVAPSHQRARTVEDRFRDNRGWSGRLVQDWDSNRSPTNTALPAVHRGRPSWKLSKQTIAELHLATFLLASAAIHSDLACRQHSTTAWSQGRVCGAVCGRGGRRDGEGRESYLPVL